MTIEKKYHLVFPSFMYILIDGKFVFKHHVNGQTCNQRVVVDVPLYWSELRPLHRKRSPIMDIIKQEFDQIDSTKFIIEGFL